MAGSFDLAKPNRTIQVGVVLMDSETEILDVAPVDLLYGMSKLLVNDFGDSFLPPNLKAQALDMDFHWVNQTGKTARLTGGASVQPTDDFTTCPPLDIVIMGAHKQSYNANEIELAFVRKSYETCSAFITICGGFQTALQAGLFVDKTATAPRLFLSHLREAAPQTNWVVKRWQRDGKLWTSGTLLNGLDLIRAFVTEYWGGEGTLAEFTVELGHFPKRDVDYKDTTSQL
ncbi:class I glutamine amidotransferase-like protein [Exophiala viscosa]|uniref:Class I glutamine amidotransferase-like protein n=1 Tax=Exophiala viscosa TaxID=2486360 RepID=A0AAN6IEC7_9EURO|nr:class I glutamine amidotransferase-like protein [Exophiala viscosa]KAI1621598.1 class I glutamine amidotransferase-like protein [Exophiala viscosa]